MLSSMGKRVLIVNMVEGSCHYEPADMPEDAAAGLPLALELYARYGRKSFTIAFSPAGFNTVFTSPQSGNVYYSFASAPLFSSLMAAGLSGIVIIGVARKLSYLYLAEERAEVRQCEQLRFTPVSEFARIIADDGLLVAIGRAGEKGSAYASILSADGTELARGGAGAVLGSLNLKGVVVAAASVNSSHPAGTLPPFDVGLKYGWLPFEYFKGKSDPRLFHLAKLKDNVLAAAAANMGIFSPERAGLFKRVCSEEGFSLLETAEVIAFLRFNGDLEGASFEEIVSYIHQMGEGRKIPDREGMLLTGGHPSLLDFRGALSWAVFASFSEGFIPYTELSLGLSRRYSARTMGIFSAYLRIYAHASMCLGNRPEILKNLKLVPDSPFLVRKVFSAMLKEKEFALAGLHSIKRYDGIRGDRSAVPDYFISNVEENADNLRYHILMEAYDLEMAMIEEKLKRKA